jgi:hypothetical protein
VAIGEVAELEHAVHRPTDAGAVTTALPRGLLDVHRLLVEPDVVAARRDRNVRAQLGREPRRRDPRTSGRRDEDTSTLGRPRDRIGPLEFERCQIGRPDRTRLEGDDSGP